MILGCSRFTAPPAPALAPIPLPSPPASPNHFNHITQYVCPKDSEEAIVDDSDEYDSPLSPASTCSSDEGSLTSSCSTIDSDYDDEFEPDLSDVSQPGGSPVIHDPDEAGILVAQEFVPFQGLVQDMIQPMPIPVQQFACPPEPKAHPRFYWDMPLKVAQPQLNVHHPMPFHHQVSPMFPLHGY